MSTTTQPTALIGPVLALAGWTFVMEIWLYAYRIPDFTTYKIKASPLTSKSTLEAQIPRHRHFPADNFAHLHEQPTVFYAVALASTCLGLGDDGVMVGLAWMYVGARVVHSLVQATTNVIMRRFGVFAVSGVVLAGMTGRAGMVWWLNN